jgi:serine protease
LKTTRFCIATLLALVACALLSVGANAATTDSGAFSPTGGAAYSPDSLVVGFDSDTSVKDGSAAVASTKVGTVGKAGPRSAVVRLHDDESLKAAAARISKRPGVSYVKPNYIARTSDAFVPNDPGRDALAGDWQQIQWNFSGAYGINVLPAWGHMRDIGVEGGRGAVVAVIDTGVAYETIGPFRRSPDLAGARIRDAYDFVDNDRHANDRNGHGTHVASTIVEQTNNGVGVTGIAYGATLMPLRALDSAGLGDEATVARAIRYAADHGADALNLSVEFDVRLGARDLPTIVSAMRYARKKGTLVVAAAGNQAARAVSYPARSNYALAVGATTIHGCIADYSDVGPGLDIVAPGGGADSGVIDVRKGSTDRTNCSFSGQPAPVYQMTFGRNLKRFGLPGGYEGTSMATPHVTATAALIVASGILGPNPTPAAIVARIEGTAKDLGYPGFDSRYGFGLVDAGNAVGAPPPLVVPPGV